MDKISLSVSWQFSNKQVRPDVLAKLRARALAKAAAGEIYKRTGKVYTESDCDSVPLGWNWTNVQYTLTELYQHISRGDAFCVAHLKDKHRISNDFASSQLIGVDLDRNATIPALLQNDFVARYAGMLYPSASDTPELHKTRVLFRLDRPIADEKEYRDLVLRVLGKFAEFGAMADPHCKDAVRLFYGSTKATAENSVITGKTLPVDMIKALPLPANQRPPEWYAQKGVDTARLIIQHSVNGSKHGELLKAARLLGGYVGGGLLLESEAIAILETEIERKADVHDLNGAYATIRDGIANGRAEPFTLAELEGQRQTYLKVNGYSMPTNGHGPQAQGNNAPTKPTQDELRDRWLDTQEYIAFGLGEWRRYHDGLWQVESDSEMKRSVSRIIEAAKGEGIRPTTALINSVAEMARWEVDKGDSIWDANSDILVCRNGTFCIPDRTLGEHRPEYYATSGVEYDFDPQARALAWEHFLGNLAKSTSPAVVSFLQEFSGYSLTTDTSHELSIWLYGPPGSGKSTFLAGLEAMLGNRAGLLGLADIVNNRFALANLPGKTLALSTEQPGDYIASTNVLNALISGETIKVDIKFRPAIEITPRCKIAWAMNELPRVSDPNSGLFRRVKVVEFPAIPEAQQEPQLKEDIKTEGAGILVWALDGLARLRNRGRFEIPPEVKEATEQFKATNDIPAQFVAECCVTGYDSQNEPYRVSGSQLYEAYKTWCLTTGHKVQSSTTIANDWRRLKAEKYLSGGKAFWRYLGLRV